LSLSVQLPDHAVRRDNGFTRWSIATLGLVLVIASVVAAYSLFDLGLELPWSALLVPCSLALGGAVLFVKVYRDRLVSPVLFGSLVTALLVIYASIAVIGLPVLERTRPTASVAQGLRPRLGADEHVGIYRLDKWRFSLRYYLERPVNALETSGDVQKFLTTQRGYVLMFDEDFEKLKKDGLKLRAVSEQPAVTGTTGKGLRRQKWGSLVVATSDDTPRTEEKSR
jgi:hypothetical protein